MSVATITMPVLACSRCGQRHSDLMFSEVRSVKPEIRRFRARCLGGKARSKTLSIYAEYEEINANQP